MSKIINWNNLKESSLYEQLKNNLINQFNSDKLNIAKEYDSTEVGEQLEYLDQNYKLYTDKLSFVSKADFLDENDKKRYVSTLAKIDCLDFLTEKNKLKMMLSYSVLVNYFKRIHERTDEQLFMLSACSSGLDLEDYTYYIGILSDSKVADAITYQTPDFMEQVNIAYDIMDAQDEFPYDFITRSNYDTLVENGVKVARNYMLTFKRMKK